MVEDYICLEERCTKNIYDKQYEHDGTNSALWKLTITSLAPVLPNCLQCGIWNNQNLSHEHVSAVWLHITEYIHLCSADLPLLWPVACKFGNTVKAFCFICILIHFYLYFRMKVSKAVISHVSIFLVPHVLLWSDNCGKIHTYTVMHNSAYSILKYFFLFNIVHISCFPALNMHSCWTAELKFHYVDLIKYFVHLICFL